MTGNTTLLRRASGLATTLIALAAVVVLVLVAFAIGTQFGTNGGDATAGEQAGQTNAGADDASRQRRDRSQTDRNSADANRNSTTAPNQQPVGGPPPVDIQPAQFDFGVIAPGETTQTSVRIFNTSPNELRVVNTRSSYSGASVDQSNNTIAPGGSLELNLTYNATTMLGSKSSALRVIFDGYDPIDINIVGTVALAVRAEPGYLQARTEMSGTVTFSARDGQPFEILSIDQREPNFVNYDPESDTPRSEYQVTWDISDLDPQTCRLGDGQPLRSYWVVETTHPNCPVLDIYIRHRCSAPDSLTPGQQWLLAERRAFVGQVEPGSSKEVEFGLRWLPSARSFESVRSVTSENPEQFTATLLRDEGTGADTRYFMRLDFNEQYEDVIYGYVNVSTGQFSRKLLVTGSARR